MTAFLLIAGVLGACNALFAAVAWKVLSRDTRRPRLARAAGAVLGAMAGAWVTEPQLAFVVGQLGYVQEAAGIAIAFTFPFLLPVTTGMGGWLFAETAGGRSSRSWLAAAMSSAGTVLGAALILLPIYLGPGASPVISYPIVLGVPIAGSMFGLYFEARLKPELR